MARTRKTERKTESHRRKKEKDKLKAVEETKKVMENQEDEEEVDELEQAFSDSFLEWIQMHNQSPEKKKVVWKDWVFSQRLIEEVQNAATNLSSQCYPFGKSVAPLHGVEDWIIGYGYPDFVFAEDELREMIFTETM
ncbi:hypothetical protein DAPPUDRAFT_324815 [Daphnia pulex]|uniref:Uncharacterized protein n=1 Tax=Daphnia pulex TaxID=6669 RepID=E9H2S9_DAPPU|nr:hypothetical protein DAPPUDRAFT_324815 [Daphnia pulex]|eukprot:EFX73835.1 hypothetical protein DAPPUDRAFT_324815 [Daphnia pulex]